MEYTLIRSRRKTLGLEIGEEGTLIVRAPQNLKESDIQKMLRQKHDWIIKKQKAMKERSIQKPAFDFRHGECFFVWGEQKPLDIVLNPKRNQMEAILKEDRIKIRTPVEEPHPIRNLMEAWYRSMTREFIEGCVAHYQPVFSKKVNRITIKDQKSRWGSCSSKNNLNFNWRLSMAPKEVVEYVVVHEMCHLVHMNHSKAFWELVEKFIPNYKDMRKWLKDYGHLMYWE